MYGSLTVHWVIAGTAESGQRHEDPLVTARRPADLGGSLSLSLWPSLSRPNGWICTSAA